MEQGDRMRFDEKDRIAKVYIGAKQVSDKSTEERFDAMIDMNDAVLSICIDSIKNETPNLTERSLLNELRKRYWL